MTAICTTPLKCTRQQIKLVLYIATNTRSTGGQLFCKLLQIRPIHRNSFTKAIRNIYYTAEHSLNHIIGHFSEKKNHVFMYNFYYGCNDYELINH